MDVTTPHTTQTVKTRQLRPGMSLSSDVKDRSGRTLLRAGATLEEKHLRVFMTWGITEVEIVADGIDDEKKPSEHIPPQLLEQARKEADRRFVHTDCDHPAMKELYDLAVIRIANGHTGGEGHDHHPR